MPENSISKLKAFVPSWPSVIMGTGALTIALSLSSKIIPAIGYLASAFLIITTAMTIFILITWILRIIHHPSLLWEDLKHPVTGSFVPTMPISLMILALAILQVGPNLIGADLSYKSACVLFWTGTVGIYIFSWIIIPLLFQNETVSYDHGTFGWYIPPVSHLIIPVLGFDLLHISHNGDHISIILAIEYMKGGIMKNPGPRVPTDFPSLRRTRRSHSGRIWNIFAIVLENQSIKSVRTTPSATCPGSGGLLRAASRLPAALLNIGHTIKYHIGIAIPHLTTFLINDWTGFLLNFI